MQASTDNFSDDSYIDQGGFGKVYRGTLKDKTMVAIKTLDRKGLQVGWPNWFCLFLPEDYLQWA